MEICECGTPQWEHHPSLHYAQKRDELIVHAHKFIDEVYPHDIFGETFNRKQVELIAACFVLEMRAQNPVHRYDTTPQSHADVVEGKV